MPFRIPFDDFKQFCMVGLDFGDGGGFTTTTENIRVVRRAIPGVDLPAITDIAVYNDRVVKVEFADGTYTKCVAEVDDDGNTEFNLYTGIAFCLFKKLLGKDGHKKFNDLMRYALRRDKQITKVRNEQARMKREKQNRARKVELKRAAKQVKQRQEQIDIQETAMLEALRKFRAEAGKDLM